MTIPHHKAGGFSLIEVCLSALLVTSGALAGVKLTLVFHASLNSLHERQLHYQVLTSELHRLEILRQQTFNTGLPFVPPANDIPLCPDACVVSSEWAHPRLSVTLSWPSAAGSELELTRERTITHTAFERPELWFQVNQWVAPQVGQPGL
ncbi:hypothetical protein DXV75_02415 [Alteromonas aestuariivivens]|uniref:Uncharacterized protein n=1 Tax=Alteromonas aestuariivivens TaxID=1938339 RepID=A0A3D8MEY1_9ALTE|nr:hypothetical protein [Alteromonas aestuariivivens]RDV29323.1 hypothetical protein DXV75_02415 [Alteromonas aestuariivivens]